MPVQFKHSLKEGLDKGCPMESAWLQASILSRLKTNPCINQRQKIIK